MQAMFSCMQQPFQCCFLFLVFDENLKKQAVELFNQLGIDMSSAMNIFLRQCVMRGGLPFKVELPQYKPEVIEAMEEAKRISKDPSTKRYSSFSEALEDLEE